MVQSVNQIVAETLQNWDEIRDRVLPPTFISELDDSEDLRVESLRGAYALGLIGRRKEIKPQQLLVFDLLNSCRRFSTILMPRRSSKTTSIIMWALGRCITRNDYRVAYTSMTTGKKAGDKFDKDIAPILESVWPDRDTRPFKVLHGSGSKRVVFDNGSIFQILAPIGDDFRSDSFDVIILDESGEPDILKVDEVMSAALPTQDTNPGAMMIITGTAGDFEEGNLLWDYIEQAKKDDTGRHALLAYMAPHHTSGDELESWEPSEEHPAGHVRELVESVHPGIGTLTTLESVKDNYDHMKPAQFAREYLGMFTDLHGSSSLIDAKKWQEAKQDGDLPEPPARFALVITVHPDQISASITAAWRDEEGRACGGVIDHRNGVKWVAEKANQLARRYKVPIIHDSQGAVVVEAEWLARQNPRPRLEPQLWRDVRTSAALLVKEIENGNFRHWNQPSLNNAAALAIKRTAGPTNWALGRKRPDDDIIDLEGIAMGLRYFDEKPQRKRPVVILPRAA